MKRSSKACLIVTLTTGLAAGCGTGGGGGGGSTAPIASPAPSPTSTPTPAPASSALPITSSGVADLVDRVKGAVVNIDTKGTSTSTSDTGSPAPSTWIGVGSGFVLRPDGLILTNHHVISGANSVFVTFADGRRLAGGVVGDDPVTDLALVRVQATGLQTLPLADPAGLRVGQFVVALGSPEWLQQSVTWGILSAIKRHTGAFARVNYLQTDAPINPGNSGGPLLNLDGQVIGINTWRLETDLSGRPVQNISFAISVGSIQEVLPQLESTGKVSYSWLGLRMVQTFDGDVYVGYVYADSPADKAGLKVGDRLLTLNDQPVQSSEWVMEQLVKLPVGAAISIKVLREGQEQTIQTTLAEIPSQQPRSASTIAGAY
jgi:serine protease Do